MPLKVAPKVTGHRDILTTSAHDVEKRGQTKVQLPSKNADQLPTTAKEQTDP
ncbi:MAG: hypothetical protein IPL39_25665 [Opitutaceae bacterium]|nr:hypothetical protein [Opitutaceae bacterium]